MMNKDGALNFPGIRRGLILLPRKEKKAKPAACGHGSATQKRSKEKGWSAHALKQDTGLQ